MATNDIPRFILLFVYFVYNNFSVINTKKKQIRSIKTKLIDGFSFSTKHIYQIIFVDKFKRDSHLEFAIENARHYFFLSFAMVAPY